MLFSKPVGIGELLLGLLPAALSGQGYACAVQPVAQGSCCHTHVGGDCGHWLAGVDAACDVVDVDRCQSHNVTLDTAADAGHGPCGRGVLDLGVRAIGQPVERERAV